MAYWDFCEFQQGGGFNEIRSTAMTTTFAQQSRSDVTSLRPCPAMQCNSINIYYTYAPWYKAELRSSTGFKEFL